MDDRYYTNFLEKCFGSCAKGKNKAEDEETFKQLLKQGKPTGAQIAWLRHTIFDSAKKKLKTCSKDDDLVMVVMDKTHDLVKVLETNALQPVSKLRVSLFFPDPQSFDTLYRYLRSARSSLDICVFTITDDRISQLLIEAHRRNVNIRIITDDEKSVDIGADIQDFRKAGIHVRMDNSPYHMHHKFCIIDNSILINGSFNWTRSASTKNNENVTIVDDQELIGHFKKEFDRLWNMFGEESETRVVEPRPEDVKHPLKRAGTAIELSPHKMPRSPSHYLQVPRSPNYPRSPTHSPQRPDDVHDGKKSPTHIKF